MTQQRIFGRVSTMFKSADQMIGAAKELHYQMGSIKTREPGTGFTGMWMAGIFAADAAAQMLAMTSMDGTAVHDITYVSKLKAIMEDKLSKEEWGFCLCALDLARRAKQPFMGLSGLNSNTNMHFSELPPEKLAEYKKELRAAATILLNKISNTEITKETPSHPVGQTTPTEEPSRAPVMAATS